MKLPKAEITGIKMGVSGRDIRNELMSCKCSTEGGDRWK